MVTGIIITGLLIGGMFGLVITAVFFMLIATVEMDEPDYVPIDFRNDDIFLTIYEED